MDEMKNIKELVVFAANLVNDTQEALADDGKITAKDALKYKESGVSLIAAVKDFGQVKKEWESRTDEAMADVVSAAAAIFDLPNDAVEDWVEDVVEWAFQTADLVDRGIALF